MDNKKPGVHIVHIEGIEGIFIVDTLCELWTLWTCGQVNFNRYKLTHENGSHLDIFNLKEYRYKIIHIIHIQHPQGSHANSHCPHSYPHHAHN